MSFYATRFSFDGKNSEDYSLTISCYQSNILGMACGVCDSCMLRKRGFAMLKIADPTKYQLKL